MIAKTTLAIAAMLMASAATAQTIDSKVQARIDRILKATPLIDGHNDLPGALGDYYKGSVEGLASGTDKRQPNPLMTDMARLHQGRVGAQFWSVYIDFNLRGDEAIRGTIEQIDTTKRMIKAYPNDLALALTADDVVRIHKTGRVASLIGIEGGHQIGGNLAALRQFYDLGARYMTLAHFTNNEFADSSNDDPKYHGLNDFGRVVVHEMNRLGMLVDLSHVSEETMRAALKVSRAPVIFSHSSARALDDHPRNVPDDVLRLVTPNGGVVMINFFAGYVSDAFRRWNADETAEEARLKALFPGRTDRARKRAKDLEGGTSGTGRYGWPDRRPCRPRREDRRLRSCRHRWGSRWNSLRSGAGGHEHGERLSAVVRRADSTGLVRREPGQACRRQRAAGDAADRGCCGIDEGRTASDGETFSRTCQMSGTPPEQPLRAAIIPVTPLQQNCTLLWCTATMRGAFVDPGGDLPRLKAAAAQAGVTIEKILLTHGHIDHCGSAGVLAEELGVHIEGPHEADRYWIDRLAEDGAQVWRPRASRSSRHAGWSMATRSRSETSTFDVRHCPGHTPGHIVFHHPDSKLALVGDVLFKGSVGRWDFPHGNQQDLIHSITSGYGRWATTPPSFPATARCRRLATNEAPTPMSVTRRWQPRA